MDDLDVFESHRPALLALGYRMLGDVGRAEDIVQDAWLRWRDRGIAVDAPKAYLSTIVTRLCLNELDSARMRREESRSDRLPEPIDLARSPLGRLEAIDRISMAFLVVLQRLTAAERAALLLHDVFDFDYAEIATILEKRAAACRQLVSRARQQVRAERRLFDVSRDEHTRLLRAFLDAATSGDAAALAALLSADATLTIDAGADGASFGRVRNLPGPLTGAAKIAAFIAAVTPQGSTDLTVHECDLNGQPAALVLRNGRAFTAILLAVTGGRIRHVFMQADPSRLGHLPALAAPD